MSCDYNIILYVHSFPLNSAPSLIVLPIPQSFPFPHPYPSIYWPSLQFLCDAIGVLIHSSPKMLPSISCLCVQQFIGDGMVLNVELAEYSDFVFLLSKLWEVDMDAVKLHWVFAAGLVDQGKQVCIVTVDNLRFCVCVCVGGGDIQLLKR